MTIKSGFFDAVETSSGVYDRVYDAADFAQYFSLFIGNGVFPSPSTGLQVTSTTTPSMNVVVLPGNGWINGYYLSTDENESLSVATANATLNRVDSIVMRLDLSTRLISLAVKTGAPSANPVAPTLNRNTSTWELELAQILVKAGSANVTQDMITDMRQNSSRCGIVSGVVDQIDATGLFAQYTAAFNEWFNGVRETLTTDVAANLQSQINDNKSKSLELTLSSTGWLNNQQTLSNSDLIVDGYKYIVSPAYESKKNYDKAKIEAKDVTETGKMTFVCSKVPVVSLTVQVLRVRV